MDNNLNQFSYPNDSLSFREIIKILLESKKILISTLLFFTISSFFYSLNLKPKFKSSTIIEIGYSEIFDGTRVLIENPSDLISELMVLRLKNPSNKFTQHVSINSLENKLIGLETTSSSVEKNENLLAEIIRFIVSRHSNLSLLKNNQKKDEISLQIEMIESELSFIRAKELSKIEDRLSILTNELPFIEQEISQLEKIILDDTNNLSLLKENKNLLKERAANSPTLEQIIFNYKIQINSLNRNKSSHIQEIKSLNNQIKNLENDSSQSDQLFRLEQEKVTLENDLQVLMNQTQVNSRIVGGIETINVKPKTQLIMSAAVLIGFFTGIFLVFISNFLKSYREVKA